MFRRSPNVLDPNFWHEVAVALPDEAERIVKLFSDWIAYARDKGGTARIAFAALAFAGLAVFTVGLVRWWRRRAFIARIGRATAWRSRRLRCSCAARLAAPIAVFLVLELLDQFQLVPPGYERLVAGLIFGTAMAALRARRRDQRARAGRSGAAPGQLRRCTARSGFRPIWSGAAGSSARSSMLRALHRIVGGPEAVDIALRMLFALSIAALLVHLLVRERETEEAEERRIPGVRLLAWIAVAVIAGALLAGYARFAAFIGGPRRLHAHADRDALSAADRHRRGDQPHACRRTRRPGASSRASSASIRAGSACSASSPPASCARCSC